MEAFVPNNPTTELFGRRKLASPEVQPPRRERRALVTAARSLDSYRSGSRFNKPKIDSMEPLATRHTTQQKARQSADAAPSPPVKKLHVSLVRALMALNIASMETCSFIIRAGWVRVNGVLTTDEKARVHRADDRLFVNGKDVGTVERRAEHVDERQERMPRSQRDRSHMDVDSLSRSYTRGTDGGFLASKKRRSIR